MDVNLIETESKNVFSAIISPANQKEMPLKKDDWQFNWRNLYKTDNAFFYKITLEETPEQVEGMLMLTLLFDEMVYMNNIEIAPHNYGSKGRFKNVAGCLIAYACRESFKKGRGNYVGFLSFDSKTVLIDLYQKKYGASIAMGQKMYIESEVGKQLARKYLNIEIG